MKRFGLFFLCAALAASGCNGSSSSSLVPPPTPPAALDSTCRHLAARESQLQQSCSWAFRARQRRPPGYASRLGGARRAARCRSNRSRWRATNQFALGTDISHSHGAFEVECDPNASNVCQKDGFDLITFGQALYGPPAKLYPYGAVKRSETKAYWDFASQYGIADNMFFTETASSFIAHQQIISGTTRLNSTESLTDQPDATAVGLRRSARYRDRDHQDQRASERVRRPVPVLHAVWDDGRFIGRGQCLMEVLRRPR